jgi:hypothetical protein
VGFIVFWHFLESTCQNYYLYYLEGTHRSGTIFAWKRGQILRYLLRITKIVLLIFIPYPSLTLSLIDIL